MPARTPLVPSAASVGGLHAPNLAALGMGSLAEIQGVAPGGTAGTAHGKAAEPFGGQGHHDGPLGDRRHRPGRCVPDLSERLPAGDHRAVLPRHRTRGPGEPGRVGDRDHRRARGGARSNRAAHRLHERRFRVPDRHARRRGTARTALRVVPRRAGDPDRRTPNGPRHRPAVRGAGGRVRQDPGPPRLLGGTTRRHGARPLPAGRGRCVRRGQDRRHLLGTRPERLRVLPFERRRHRHHAVPTSNAPDARCSS